MARIAAWTHAASQATSFSGSWRSGSNCTCRAFGILLVAVDDVAIDVDAKTLEIGDFHCAGMTHAGGSKRYPARACASTVITLLSGRGDEIK